MMECPGEPWIWNNGMPDPMKGQPEGLFPLRLCSGWPLPYLYPHPLRRERRRRFNLPRPLMNQIATPALFPRNLDPKRRARPAPKESLWERDPFGTMTLPSSISAIVSTPFSYNHSTARICEIRVNPRNPRSHIKPKEAEPGSEPECGRRKMNVGDYPSQDNPKSPLLREKLGHIDIE